MRLGGPIFKKAVDPKTAVDIHRKLGFGAAFATHIEDEAKRKEFVAAFEEADITLAEYGSYCINILDTDPKVREANVQQIIRPRTVRSLQIASPSTAASATPCSGAKKASSPCSYSGPEKLSMP